MKKLIMIVLVMFLMLGCTPKEETLDNENLPKVTTTNVVTTTTTLTSQESTTAQVSSNNETFVTTITSANSTTKSETGSLLSKGYVDILKSKHYFMEYRLYANVDNQEVETLVHLFVDGEKMATEVNIAQMIIRVVYKKDAIYQIDDFNKTFMKLPLTQTGSEEAFGKADDMKYLGSGTGNIRGKNLKYEEYEVENGKMRFYFSTTNKLYAIVSIVPEGEAAMIISGISKDYKENNVFDIPNDYLEIKLN